MTDYPHLLAPLSLGELRLRNRVVVTAHVTNFGSHEHLATPRTAAYLAERARGGAGLIVSESLAVHPTAGPNTFFLQLWDDAAVAPLRAVTSAVRGHGAAIVAQLNHGGREHNPRVTRRPLVAPSPIASPKGGEVPHELTVEEIEELVDAFAAAATRALAAGFQGVEVHAGHGYLIQQFLSPWSNHRTDAYGGDVEGRMRFLVEVLQTVRSALPRPTVVGVRISADEFAPGGLDVEAMREVSRRVEQLGLVDYLSVSQGSYADPGTFIPDASHGRLPFVHLTRAIREVVDLPVVAVGSIVTPEEAESVLAAGTADLVGMTRAHISDPHLVRKVEEGRTEDIRQCILCNQGCYGRLLTGLDISCVQNPAVGRELDWPEFPPPRAAHARRVVVVGGGPAGLEAAWVAAARGHQVSLHETQAHLGGQVRTFSTQDGHREWAHVVTWRERMLARYCVQVHTSSRADARTVLAQEPEVVVVGTGPGGTDPGGPGLVAELRARAGPDLRILTVGDAAAPRDALAALTDGHRVGREI
ncbi:NAD(P)-binding protein [Ornithinimicrobium sufpigmenti]|uniref:oxidoreductase n=1 Tax=Ornithinimicrobium sufpigmenti TaxID=2508882 RepID=UPI0010358FA0|nr:MULTISPECIES: NAD(P)-binding protein [unclassified Ornithinimicrobium]